MDIKETHSFLANTISHFPWCRSIGIGGDKVFLYIAIGSTQEAEKVIEKLGLIASVEIKEIGEIIPLVCEKPQ